MDSNMGGKANNLKHDMLAIM